MGTLRSLYYVKCETVDGDDLSVHVATDYVDTAIQMWRDYYELDASENPEYVYTICQTEAPEGPIAWNHMERFKVLANGDYVDDTL